MAQISFYNALKSIKNRGGGYLGDLKQRTYQSYLPFRSCSNDLKSLRRVTMRLLSSVELKQKFGVTLISSLRQSTLNTLKNRCSVK